MKRTCLLSLIIVLFSGLLVATGAASGPGLINYQGLLKDSSGDPLTGTVSVTFKIYDAATGDNILWQETHTDVSVSDGQLSVILGQGTPPAEIGDEVFESAERWLGVTIGGDPEITPRTRLVSVPYSHRVNTVEGAEAGVINGVLEIGTSSKDGSRYESGIIVTGTGADSVIISPADDIIIRGTTDDGDAAIFMGTVTDAGVSSGIVEISSTDAAKAGNRVVLINPGDSIVLQGTDGNGDVAISMGMNEYGGVLQVSSTDAARAVTQLVEIDPALGIALQAHDDMGDTLLSLSTSGDAGKLSLFSAAKAGSRVEITNDGIVFWDATRSDTNMIIWANGDIVGKGQLAMGLNNDLSDIWSNVLGFNNVAIGDSAVICGGYDNTTEGDASSIAGGYNNTILEWGDQGFIGAGNNNSLSSFCGVIVGGRENSTTTSTHSAILGGWKNAITNGYCFLGGGQDDTVSGSHAVICGGRTNRAAGNRSFIGGGNKNYAMGECATVCGGDQDSASGAWATVSGGVYNAARDDYATVCGGRSNKAEDRWATVLGGNYNNAVGEMSVAAGCLAKANHNGSVVITANCSFVSSDSTRSGGVDQMVLRADGGIYLTNTAELAPYDNSRLITTRGGAYLSGNGTSWTDASDRNLKENFVDLNYADILAKLRQLPMSEWNYIAEDDGVRHVGPMGQDFYGIFGIGQDEKSISARDLASVALIAAQELDRKTEQLKSSLKEIEDLRRELDELKNLVKSISKSED